MLEIGRGENWDIAFDTQEIDLAFAHLRAYRKTHPERIKELADVYKHQCFIDPTDQNIEKAFQFNRSKGDPV